MPDEQGNTTADSGTTPDTPMHAYKEGRKEDVVGDADKLESTDPKDMQRKELDPEDESADLGPSQPEKH